MHRALCGCRSAHPPKGCGSISLPLPGRTAVRGGNLVGFCAAVRRQRSWSWAAARPPCMGHGLHISPRRNLTLGLYSNRGRCQLPRGTPLGTATLGGEGCSPLVTRAPYGARCHVALFPSSFLFRYEGAVGSIGVKWRIALHLAPIRLAASISPQATYMSSVGVAARRPISWSLSLCSPLTVVLVFRIL